jgi:hypothetical protein
VSDHILSVEMMKKVLGSLPIISSFTNIGATWYHRPPPWSGWVISMDLCRALHVVSAFRQSSFQLAKFTNVKSSIDAYASVEGSTNLPLIRSFTNIGATGYHRPPPWSSWVISKDLCRALHVVSAYWQSSFQLIRYLRSSQLSNLASTLLLLLFGWWSLLRSSVI